MPKIHLGKLHIKLSGKGIDWYSDEDRSTIHHWGSRPSQTDAENRFSGSDGYASDDVHAPWGAFVSEEETSDFAEGHWEEALSEDDEMASEFEDDEAMPSIFHQMSEDFSPEAYAEAYEQMADDAPFSEEVDWPDAPRKEPRVSFWASDWGTYLALLLLPPLGIRLLWQRNRHDVAVRSILSLTASIWFIMIMMFFFDKITPKGEDISFLPPRPNTSSAVNASVSPIASPTGIPTSSPTPRTSPSTTPTSSPSSHPGAPVSYVYVMNNGTYYHSESNCANITAPTSRVTLDAATTRGMSACPKCYGVITAGTTYYCTDRGTWYHVDKTCQDMNNAYEVTEAAAILKGKTACPTCIGYFGTPGGTYYHCYSNCTGPNSTAEMKNAVVNTKAYWEENRKTPCPKCLAGSQSTSTVSTVDEQKQTRVYGNLGGKWFHAGATCREMKSSTAVSIAVAAANQLTACPYCVTADAIYVFAREDGTWFHTDSTCTNMKKAQRVTIAMARAYGKIPCPTCATMLQAIR